MRIDKPKVLDLSPWPIIKMITVMWVLSAGAGTEGVGGFILFKSRAPKISLLNHNVLNFQLDFRQNCWRY